MQIPCIMVNSFCIMWSQTRSAIQTQINQVLRTSSISTWHHHNLPRLTTSLMRPLEMLINILLHHFDWTMNMFVSMFVSVCDPHCTSGCTDKLGTRCDTACASGYYLDTTSFLGTYKCISSTGTNLFYDTSNIRSTNIINVAFCGSTYICLNSIRTCFQYIKLYSSLPH